MVYIGVALMFGLVYFLYKTRAGLVLRSVGESPESAQSPTAHREAETAKAHRG